MEHKGHKGFFAPSFITVPVSINAHSVPSGVCECEMTTPFTGEATVPHSAPFQWNNFSLSFLYSPPASDVLKNVLSATNK